MPNPGPINITRHTETRISSWRGGCLETAPDKNISRSTFAASTSERRIISAPPVLLCARRATLLSQRPRWCDVRVAAFFLKLPGTISDSNPASAATLALVSG